MRKLFFYTLFLFSILLLSCSKSNEEDLNQNQGTNPSNCSTLNVSYSSDISPILQSNCNSCHSSLSPLGSVITDNYTGLKRIAENGLLIGTITHASGFSPMPLGTAKLSSCDIKKIKAWINQGLKNN